MPQFPQFKNSSYVTGSSLSFSELLGIAVTKTKQNQSLPSWNLLSSGDVYED